jgi:hypothetical protein
VNNFRCHIAVLNGAVHICELCEMWRAHGSEGVDVGLGGTLMFTYKITWRYNPEDQHQHLWGMKFYFWHRIPEPTRFPPSFRSVVCHLAGLWAYIILFKAYVDVCFQMILLMAIAHGKSRVKCGPVTSHTKAAIHVAHLLTEVRLIRYH